MGIPAHTHGADPTLASLLQQIKTGENPQGPPSLTPFTFEYREQLVF